MTRAQVPKELVTTGREREARILRIWTRTCLEMAQFRDQMIRQFRGSEIVLLERERERDSFPNPASTDHLLSCAANSILIHLL